MTRAVFLDRDGVLNEERSYITHPDALVLLPGAAQAVARLNAAGWLVFVFTNQSAIGRGYMSSETLEEIHARLRAELAAAGATLAGIYVCPHGPDDACNCRKPKPGLLQQAAREHSLDLTGCVVVGDTPRDIAAGHAVGCRTVLVLTGHTRLYNAATFPTPHPDRVFPDLLTATAWISAV